MMNKMQSHITAEVAHEALELWAAAGSVPEDDPDAGALMRIMADPEIQRWLSVGAMAVGRYSQGLAAGCIQFGMFLQQVLDRKQRQQGLQ